MKMAIPSLWHSLIREFSTLSVFVFYLSSFFLELFGMFICLVCCLIGSFIFGFGFFFPLGFFGCVFYCLFVIKTIQRCSCDCVKAVISSQSCQMWQLPRVWMLKDTALVELSHGIILVLNWLKIWFEANYWPSHCRKELNFYIKKECHCWAWRKRSTEQVWVVKNIFL